MYPTEGRRRAHDTHTNRKARDAKRDGKASADAFPSTRNAGTGWEVTGMKVVFAHGALVFDGAWGWHRMVEPLAALGRVSK